jgi:hypothetical protein
MRLGISVPTSDVRLIPGPQDLYKWASLPEKRYLFNKHLSKHCIRAYKEIYTEVGESFGILLLQGSQTADVSSPAICLIQHLVSRGGNLTPEGILSGTGGTSSSSREPGMAITRGSRLLVPRGLIRAREGPVLTSRGVSSSSRRDSSKFRRNNR